MVVFYECYWKFVKVGNIWYDEISLRVKDGFFFWLDLIVVFILFLIGEFEKLVVIVFDIIECKEFEFFFCKN